MNESLFSAFTTGLTSLINDLFTYWGRGLGSSIVSAAVAWYLVEQFTPPTWDRRKNVLAALLGGVCVNLLIHFSGMFSFGTPFAAGVYGLIGGAFAPVFHKFIGKPYLTKLTTPNPENK